jgi:outer membrane protein assembly factor BamB
MLRPTAAAFLLLCLTPASQSHAGEDWFQFRGPDGQGHSTATGLPTHWSTTENVRWKQAIPGRGWSSPVCVGNQIFLTTAVPADSSHALHTLSLEASTGKIIWDTVVFDRLIPTRAQMHSKNSYASPTPVVHGERVYVHFGTQGTACLSLAGKVIWKTRELVYQPNHGSGGSPVLVDGFLIVSCGGADLQFVAALDANTGDLRWKKDRLPCEEPKRFAFGTPLLIEVNGQKQVISPGAHMVVAYDPKTGDELWSVRYDGYSVVPRPVFGNGLVYLSTSFDSAQLLAIRPDGHGNVTDSHVAWKQARSIPNTPSPLLVDENLFLINDAGIASCLDAKTGRPRWTHRLGGKFSASPLQAEGHIYVVSEGGETTVLRATPEHYEEIARNKLDEEALASPVVVGHGLLLRTAKKLYRMEN